jgi:hypothetical protein
LNIPKYIYRKGRRLRKIDSPYPICSSKSFPLQNIPKYIYKRAKGLGKFDSPYPICSSKYFLLLNIPAFTSTKELKSYENLIPPYPICFSKSFPSLNIPNYMYKRARRLRKLDSPHSINSLNFFFC